MQGLQKWKHREDQNVLHFLKINKLINFKSITFKGDKFPSGITLQP